MKRQVKEKIKENEDINNLEEEKEIDVLAQDDLVGG
jgi:hypothetical protein